VRRGEGGGGKGEGFAVVERWKSYGEWAGQHIREVWVQLYGGRVEAEVTEEVYPPIMGIRGIRGGDTKREERERKTGRGGGGGSERMIN
jgi:hypothetical protein